MAPGRENKPHIGIYGRCNSGKSSLLNFITQSNASLVCDSAGTTTDPVRKSFEIIDFAPVVFIDTAGLDDVSGGGLGKLRMQKTVETFELIDLAIIVFSEWGTTEEFIIEQLTRRNTPFFALYNSRGGQPLYPAFSAPLIETNLLQADHTTRELILEMIKRTLPERSYITPSLLGNKVSAGDIVLLVCPIDSEAPSGRLILPQVQTIRDLLDNHAITIVVEPDQIAAVFDSGLCPRLVVTDSQIFDIVTAAVPRGVEITSFSILLAQVKGDYDAYKQGLDAIKNLRDGDKILILENCLHQTSCEDIGRVKLPRLLEQRTATKLNFTFVSGLSPLPADLASYALAIQCGGCMVTRSQLQNRIRAVRAAKTPITNYGMALKALMGV